MITQTQAKEITQDFFELAGEEQIEIILRSSKVQSTRFADNGITQNVSIDKSEYLIRMQKEGRQARIKGDRFDKEALKKAIEKLKQILNVSPENKKLLPFTTTPLSYTSTNGFSANTAENTPEARVEVIHSLVQKMKAEKNLAAGNYAAEAGSITYANSNGVFGYHDKTLGFLDLTTTSSEEETEGVSMEIQQDITKIDTNKVLRESIETAEKAKKAISKEPGYYTVVLHPYATSDLLYFLVRLCFRTLSYQEGTSFLSKKLGKKLFSEKFSLEENAFHPELNGMPFDFEGVAKQKCLLIDQGTPVNLVYDRFTAQQAGVSSTGHAPLQPSQIGPGPSDIVMKGGETSLEEMIASTKEGIFVNRFHYTNVLNPMELLLTGMTRAGLFWIEDGKIKHPIKNFRFTISLLDVFRNIEALGPTLLTDRTLFEESMVAPAMKVNGFHFSSNTDF